jgi:hypothetical protein
VFDRFYRAPEARSAPGSGLGLAIAQQIAEAHAGSVKAANAPGGGAVFTLRLPTGATASQRRFPAGAPGAAAASTSPQADASHRSRGLATGATLTRGPHQ